jgi:hypothetical protein
MHVTRGLLSPTLEGGGLDAILIGESVDAAEVCRRWHRERLLCDLRESFDGECALAVCKVSSTGRISIARSAFHVHSELKCATFVKQYAIPHADAKRT